MENIKIACRDCMKKKKRDFQKSFNHSDVKVGCLIKKKFFDTNGHQEHMWVAVTKLRRNGLIQGVIMNNPINLKNVSYGDIVKLRLKEIEEIKKIVTLF